MKLICPCCGATASLESWVNDAHARETLAVISRLPDPLPRCLPAYLSLFRPEKSALGWKKALRLAGEIDGLVSAGYVHVQGKVDRDCTPGMWARGMDQMVEGRAALSTPMPNHNYLKKVVHDIADQADRAREKGAGPGQGPNVYHGRQSSPEPVGIVLDPMKQYMAGMRDDKPTDEEMRVWKQSRFT